jgi:hypothetical protein
MKHEEIRIDLQQSVAVKQVSIVMHSTLDLRLSWYWTWVFLFLDLFAWT